MCSIKAPKPTPIKASKPQYLHNPYLDEARNSGASALAARSGRSSLRIPLDTGLGIGFGGRGGSQGSTGTNGPRGTAGVVPGSGASPLVRPINTAGSGSSRTSPPVKYSSLAIR